MARGRARKGIVAGEKAEARGQGHRSDGGRKGRSGLSSVACFGEESRLRTLRSVAFGSG